jgi:hypothetical protein
MTNKTANFVTDTVTVKWSHLHRPDDKFGVDTANHNITVEVDDALQKTIDKILSDMGGKKMNGMRKDEETGVSLLKAKTKWHVKKDIKVFPCVDANASATEALPFQGDKVRLRLAPIKLDRDGSISLFLNGVQIIEKNERDFNGGFDKTDGFDGSDFQVPEKEEAPEISTDGGDDLPF